MNLWCDEQIVVTIDGPRGRRKLTVPRPFARVGTHPKSEVVLGEGAGERAYYLHATSGGIYALRLDMEGRGDLDDCGRWLSRSEAITLGPYRLTARPRSRVSTPPAVPSLITIGSADIPLPVLDIFCRDEFEDKRRLQSRLVIVGRHPRCTLKLRSRKVSMLHCALFWDQRRLWCIDLFSSNGTLLNGKRIDCSEVQMHDRLTVGEFGLVYHRWSPRSSMAPGWQPSAKNAADQPRL